LFSFFFSFSSSFSYKAGMYDDDENHIELTITHRPTMDLSTTLGKAVVDGR
jgi:hypothetical protein